MYSACAFLAGFIAGLFLPSWDLVKFDNHISLGEAAAIVVAAIVALLIALVVEKYGQDGRAEKDLFLRRTEEFANKQKTLQQFSDAGSYSYSSAASVIKQMRISVCSLKERLSKHEYEDAAQLCVKLNELLGDLRDQMTDSTAPGQKMVGKRTTIKEGLISLGAAEKLLIDNTLAKVDDELFRLQLSINRQ